MHDHRGEYNELDLLYTHPVSGSRLYLGNHTSSKNLQALDRLNVTRIVNCMARNTDAALQARFGSDWRNFPVETWEGEMVRQGGDPGGGNDGNFCAVAYFAQLFSWIDEALEAPARAVLVHCFAGAHRGAAVCVAYLMHARKIRLEEALEAAQAARPIVDPKELLMELLTRLGRGTPPPRRRPGETPAPCSCSLLTAPGVRMY